MASEIANIIKSHQLAGGMPMKNIFGEDIESSCVIDSQSFVHLDDGGKRVRLLRENAITGAQIDESFTTEAFAALQGCDILSASSAPEAGMQS